MCVTVTGLMGLGLGRGVREYRGASGVSCDLNFLTKLDLLRLAFAFTRSVNRGGGSVIAIGGNFSRAEPGGWR